MLLKEALKRAADMRKSAMFGVEDYSDEKALEIPTMFPSWVVGEAVAVGNRRYYAPTEKLYKCKKEHITQADWTPDVSVSLWEVIDVTHAGTLEDPIPAAVNMTYDLGLYYLDPEDKKIYLCNRSTEIAVAYLPHDLVGTYFELVES